MHNFLRLTLLGSFGALGVGLAVCLAITSQPASDDPTAVSSTDAGTPVAGTPARGSSARGEAGRSQQPVAMEAEPSPLEPQGLRIGPFVAPYHGPVANQIDQLERNVKRAQENIQRNIRSQMQPRAAQPLPNQPGLNDLAPGGADPLPPRRIPLDPGVAPPLDDPATPRDPATPGDPAAQDTADPGRDQGDAFPGEGDRGVVINMRDTDIREVLDSFSRQGGLNILASKNVQGMVSVSLNNVDIDSALDAILRNSGYVARREGEFIFVGLPEDFDDMDHAMDRVGTRVYRPNYAKASELQALIAPILSKEVGQVSISSAAEVGIAPDSSAAGGDTFAGNEVLLVRDYEAILAQVDQVVDEVDRRPLQVSIEAMILSVKLDDSHSVGVNFELLRDRDNARLISGTPPGSLSAIDVTSGGVKFGFLDSSLSMFIDALETIGDANVIASPRLMCLNKQRAEIHIGSEEGYISTTVTENAATETVEFLELGTQLRIRPYISNDGMIRMEIHPELSTGKVDTESGFTLPNKEVTQVTTNVMVRDGCTMVIGGLIRENIKTTSTQIPVVGSLPLVGPAFRQRKEEMEKSEIIILITPHIVSEPAFHSEADLAECEFHRRQAIYKDKMSPLSTRYIGRRYFRLARIAWACGRSYTALRWINMSVHFDPLNRDALALRSEIVANSPFGDNSVDTHLRVGLMPWNQPLRGGLLSNWMLDQLEAPPGQMYVGPGAYERGRPGPVRNIEPRPPILP